MMKNYFVGICCSLMVVVSGYAQEKRAAETDSTVILDERQMLRNAAFCTCMYKSFPDSVFANEGSGAGYLELGRHSLDAYTRIFDFAGEYAKRKYESKYNRSLSIMKCLDFYNSTELDTLIKSLDSEIDMEEGSREE